MSDLENIDRLYVEIDNHLEKLRDSEEMSEQELEEITNKQLLNDQAYFVLAWGQFEAEVEDACRDVISNGQSNDNWQVSRVWSLYNSQGARIRGLNFKERLSLVLERGTPDWNQVARYYDLRNQIAHGTLHSTRIDTSVVINFLLRIQSALDRP